MAKPAKIKVMLSHIQYFLCIFIINIKLFFIVLLYNFAGLPYQTLLIRL